MSQENVEIVRQAVEAFNREDADAFVALAGLNVEWEDAIFWSGVTRTYRGRQELREWFNQVLEPWENFHCEIEEITEPGDDRVLLGLYLTASGKGSGVEAPGLRFWSVFWLTDGEVTRRQVFRERAEALDAAGLDE